MEKVKLKFPTVQHEVVAVIREEILQGVLQPGERLQERILCERFSISRSPLRDAYQVLCAEGFIDLLRNRGAIVSSPTWKDIHDNLLLMEALELLGIRLACEHASDEDLQHILALHEEETKACLEDNTKVAFEKNNEIHRSIVLASKNEALMDHHLLVSRKVMRVQKLEQLKNLITTPPAGLHDKFIEALLQRNADTAVSEFSKHHEDVQGFLTDKLSNFLG